MSLRFSPVVRGWRKSHLALAVSTLLVGLPALGETPHQDMIHGPFTSGSQVTETCLACHEEQAHDVMKTVHWNWSKEQLIDGKLVEHGKKTAINNYCIAIGGGNQQSCTRCHSGYGWKDNQFDFKDATNIDCLVCHDTTGSYVKSGQAGEPTASTIGKLERIARNVGKPVRDNCGSCHFFGGGGDAIKHGDLDSSMGYPDRDTDVHMDVDGNDMQCQACHITEKHDIPGHSMGVSPKGSSTLGCESCHDAAPHEKAQLNNHTASVACQTCHIPTFAKIEPTKMSWDWSTAGQDLPAPKDKYGKASFNKKKGHFTFAQNVEPEYAWFNGKAGAYVTGEQMIPETVTKLAWPLGDINDSSAKIYPFKVHRGSQPYDVKHRVFIPPQTTGKDGFWSTFDWDLAAELGMDKHVVMQAKGLSYSGKLDFAETEMWWRLNHMVAPKEQSLGCMDCHGKSGRMDWQALGFPADPMKNREAAAIR
ncbi:tetrathionate reductase family octaheme c-type cytochrome [Ferrimonas lipolytica]|uniref:Tetrathionate reductase family octaheme c-type cytochrome n=1 Tax=Ferrimonas lipolytica TaxID=2724191 RepID=A0A6H1UH22_9GAMM|nr:tetrathionate reductase family octaheme c-type cytochrome [Ferrimonas lipolytica]QIZ77929.1 tetrathionate reductase family octaheme c-type cytochrome [Ferrimonas lipolytica]